MRYTARSALGSDSLGSQVHVNLPHQACRFLKRLLPHHHLKTFSDRVSNSLGPQEVLDPPQEFLINLDGCFHVAVSRQCVTGQNTNIPPTPASRAGPVPPRSLDTAENLP